MPITARLLICLALAGGVAFAADVPDDWKEYDNLEPEVLCGYIENGLHGDLSELIYVLDVYRRRVDVGVGQPDGPVGKAIAATLPRAMASALSLSRVYNADTTIPKAVRQSDLASLRASVATIRAAGTKFRVEFPGGIDALPQPELPVAVAKNADSEGVPIASLETMGTIKAALMRFDKLLADGLYRDYLKESRRLPANFDRWVEADKRLPTERDSIRAQIAYALGNEEKWMLVNPAMVSVPVAAPDTLGDKIMLLALPHNQNGVKIFGFRQ